MGSPKEAAMEYLQQRVRQDAAIPSWTSQVAALFCRPCQPCMPHDEPEFDDREDDEVAATPRGMVDQFQSLAVDAAVGRTFGSSAAVMAMLPKGLPSTARPPARPPLTAHPRPLDGSRCRPPEACRRAQEDAHLSDACRRAWQEEDRQRQACGRSLSPMQERRASGAHAVQQPASLRVPARRSSVSPTPQPPARAMLPSQQCQSPYAPPRDIYLPSPPTSVSLRPSMCVLPFAQDGQQMQLSVFPPPATGRASPPAGRASPRVPARQVSISYQPPCRQQSAQSALNRSVERFHAPSTARSSSVNPPHAPRVYAPHQPSAVPSVVSIGPQLSTVPPATVSRQQSWEPPRQAAPVQVAQASNAVKANLSLSRMSTASSLSSLLEPREAKASSLKLQAGSMRRSPPWLTDLHAEHTSLQHQQLSSVRRLGLEGVGSCDTSRMFSSSSATSIAFPAEADVSLSVERDSRAIHPRSAMAHTQILQEMHVGKMCVDTSRSSISQWSGPPGSAL